MSNICIAGLQWGDEGKGKFVDYFAKDASVVVRFQGGNNAGHTIVIDGVSYKLSLLPSGILHKNKLAFIASGVVLDLESLFNEIEKIQAYGIQISPLNLKIAENISIIIPLYKKLDLLFEKLKGKDKIGTTGRGIGFAYQDKVGRRSIRLCDIFEEDTLNNRINSILDFYGAILEKHDDAFNIQEAKKETLNYILKYRDFFKNYLVPTNFLNSFAGQNILFEGAQGAMLDVSFGTYPFVTSSNTLASEVQIGSGFGKKLDRVFGVAKAYCTRVGSGPFPTESFDDDGMQMQSRGAEFGTVTGRIRRCGFLDLVSLKHIIELSGVTDIILTKIDVLDGFAKVKVCVGYKVDGKEINYLPSSEKIQAKIEPIYKEFKGWKGGYSFNKFEDLPTELKDYILFIERYTEIKVSVLSFGPERESTLNLVKVWED